jgi:hypothetical protein
MVVIARVLVYTRSKVMMVLLLLLIAQINMFLVLDWMIHYVSGTGNEDQFYIP